MRQFWRTNAKIFETALIQSFAWRTDVLFYRLYDIFHPLSLILVWTVLFSEKDVLVGYTKEQMLGYILFGHLFGVISQNWVHEGLAADIKDGKITSFLIKPIQHVRYAFCYGTGVTLQATFFASLIICVLVGFFSQQIHFSSFAPTVLAVLIAVLAFVMNMLIGICVGYLSFWIGSVWGFSNMLYLVRDLFGGHLFPLDILPHIWTKIFLLLPFAFSQYIPAQVYLGRMSLVEGGWALVHQCLWIILLWFLARWLWKKGVRRYEGVGI
jgi:ABC-2 type transport system permease protein